mmetsp:Transcript_114694/g.335375  ORF Transcript_114694/g.335375 Transcript_114694/m.335375 type:complete len:234 (+) Transcript_114694:1785-2486(+)
MRLLHHICILKSAPRAPESPNIVARRAGGDVGRRPEGNGKAAVGKQLRRRGQLLRGQGHSLRLPRRPARRHVQHAVVEITASEVPATVEVARSRHLPPARGTRRVRAGHPEHKAAPLALDQGNAIPVLPVERKEGLGLRVDLPPQMHAAPVLQKIVLLVAEALRAGLGAHSGLAGTEVAQRQGRPGSAGPCQEQRKAESCPDARRTDHGLSQGRVTRSGNKDACQQSRFHWRP